MWFIYWVYEIKKFYKNTNSLTRLSENLDKPDGNGTDMLI